MGLQHENENIRKMAHIAINKYGDSELKDQLKQELELYQQQQQRENAKKYESVNAIGFHDNGRILP